MKIWKMISPFNNRMDVPKWAFLCKKILAFVFLYMVAAVIGEGAVLGTMYALGFNPLAGEGMGSNVMVLGQYYGFAVFLIVTLVYCKVVEKRNLGDVGLNRKVVEFFGGGLVAIIMLGAIVALCCCNKSMTYRGIGRNIDVAYLVPLFWGIVIQSVAEEVMCRGFLLKALTKKLSIPVAIFASATMFALPHFSSLFEEGSIYGIIGVINLYLVAIVFSMLVLNRMNLWVSCGLHAVWNFILYGVLGMNLSGSAAKQSGIFCFQLDRVNIINGGQYGVEAGIATSFVLLVVAILLIMHRKRKGEIYGLQ